MRNSLLILLLLLSTKWVLAQSNPSAVKAEAIAEPAQTVFKTKNSDLGRFEITCRQRILGSEKELTFSWHTWDKKKKKSHLLQSLQNYNGCNQYKFHLSQELNLTQISPPGERSDEPGAKTTVVYGWNKLNDEFVEKNKIQFSPYQIVRDRYRKILATAALPKAEKLIIANQAKIENFIQIHPEEAKVLCEDFYNAYKTYGENLFKEKDYQQSFDIFLSLKKKFSSPQNAFFDHKSKNSSLVLVCPFEDSNNDISEDHFYTFARRYLDHPEFVPYMIKKARRSIQDETEDSKELAEQILKYVSFVLKSADHGFQLEQQKDLVAAWNSLVRNRADQPNYERLLNEDNQLVFLLAETKKCDDIPSAVIKRISQKGDNREILKSMTLTSANDLYADGLEKAAVFEYKQFVLGRVLLKKCEEIPKSVFDRYFKFVQAQEYEK